jgi:Uma2 family endonuclease
MPAAITELSQLDPNGHYTYADYLTWHFDERVELLWGQIFPMAAPKRRHQEASANLERLIFNYLTEKSCKGYHAPFDVRLPVPNPRKPGSAETVVQPDICVVCDLTKLDDAGCVGAPDWIVEITSPGTVKKDFNEKYTLYEQAGVREYWIVMPGDQVVYVFALQQGLYEQVGIYENSGPIASVIFPDLVVEHTDIFR